MRSDAPSAALRSAIWLRDAGRCVRCGSKHALEVDHVIPYALGGPTEFGNLRLLCRSCNGFAAIANFGQAKMKEMTKSSL